MATPAPTTVVARKRPQQTSDDQPETKRQRSLKYAKCSFCRESKKKCERHGQWPQKCERCIDRGLDCSENIIKKAGRELQVVIEAPVALYSPTVNLNEETLLDRIRVIQGLCYWLQHQLDVLNDAEKIQVQYFSYSAIEDRTYTIFKRRVEKAQALVIKMIYQVRKDMRARGNVTEVLLLSQTLTELLRSTLRLSPSAIVQPWELDPSSIQYVTEQIDELRQNNSIGLAASMQETLLLSSTMSSNPIELRQNVDLLVQLNSDHHVELPGIRAVETVPLLLRPAILENSMIVAAIIKNGNEIPSTTDALGRTALHMALDHSSVHPAQWELLHDDLEPECRTPTEKENVVDALLKWKVPIGARDIFRRTALHIACYNQVGIDIVKLLLASKQPSFQLDSKDSTGRTPFAWAVRTSQYAVAKLLLATGRVNVNSMDEIYQTPLKFAARIGNEGLVKLLLGAPGIQADCGKDDSTPLQWAFSTGHEEVLKLLIQRNDVNVNVEVEGHQTFLVWAVRRGRQELVKLLLERDDIQTETVFMTRTARQWAVFDGFEGVVRQFEDYDLRQAVVHAGRG